MPITKALRMWGLTASDFDRPVGCWAGDRIGESYGGPACHCKITDDLITAAQNPSSLAAYCMGDYQACPTWRDAREREWSDRPAVTEERERPAGWQDTKGRAMDFEGVPVTTNGAGPS